MNFQETINEYYLFQNGKWILVPFPYATFFDLLDLIMEATIVGDQSPGTYLMEVWFAG